MLLSLELSITLCVVLARSLCEAKRPSDLKVSPSDTRKLSGIRRWRRPRDGTKESREASERTTRE